MRASARHEQPYSDYCLELVAGMEGKFAHLPEDRMNYAYHVDATLYGRFLRKLAEADGCKRIEGKIARVELNGQNGDIAALHLDGDRRIEGDMFVDCTGFRGLLIDGALHAGFEDWSHWLPNDSAIAVQSKHLGPPQALYAGDRARCRMAMAHPAAASHGRGHRLFERLSVA